MAVLVGPIWGKISNFMFFNLIHMGEQIQSLEMQGEKKKGTGSLAKIRKGESDEM